MNDTSNPKPEVQSPRLLASVTIPQAELRLNWVATPFGGLLQCSLTLPAKDEMVRTLAVGLADACRSVALVNLRDGKPEKGPG